MDASGGNEQDLTQDPDEDGEPEWAPDGSRIAFHTSRDGNFEIYTMSPDGDDPQRLTDSPGIDLSAAWSPDGTRIAFSSNRSGRFQLHVLDLALMQTTQLTAGGSDVSSPDWQPLSPIQGDVDCNGAVNAVDALRVLKDVQAYSRPQCVSTPATWTAMARERQWTRCYCCATSRGSALRCIRSTGARTSGSPYPDGRRAKA